MMISRLTTALGWLFTLWLLLWNFLRIWPGDRWWPLALTNNFAPWLMLASFAIALLSFLLHKPTIAIASLLAALLVLVRLIPLLTANSQLSQDQPSIKVMTYNVHDRNKDFEGILSVIQSQNPDVLALQELKVGVRELLLPELESQFPYNTFESANDSQHLALLSRYEISDIFSSRDNRILSAVVQTPHARILVINVHGPSKLFPFSWDEDWKEQRDFITLLVNEYSGNDSPVILLGDFNTTYLSQNYGLLGSNFHDAFEESGKGFGLTYPAQQKFGINLPWPIVGIDFIFYNDHLVSSETLIPRKTGGSDHRPVVTVLGEKTG